VTVEAPDVTVEAPDVTVEAPGVTVDAPGVKHCQLEAMRARGFCA
jgi:phage baseplate assembly protein gpV